MSRGDAEKQGKSANVCVSHNALTSLTQALSLGCVVGFFAACLPVIALAVGLLDLREESGAWMRTAFLVLGACSGGTIAALAAMDDSACRGSQ